MTKTVEGNTATFTFTLTDGESITFNNVIPGSQATVTETSHDGYFVTVGLVGEVADAGDSWSGTVSTATSVIVTNQPGVQLPNTGGMGTRSYTLGGLAMVFAAVAAGFVTRRKAKKQRA